MTSRNIELPRIVVAWLAMQASKGMLIMPKIDSVFHAIMACLNLMLGVGLALTAIVLTYQWARAFYAEMRSDA